MSAKRHCLRWASLLVLIPFLSKLVASISVIDTAAETSLPGAEHTVEDTAPNANEHHTHTQEPQSSSSTFLLLCLTDGSLYTMDAWTGELSSRSTTEPLLRKNHAASEKQDEDMPSSSSSPPSESSSSSSASSPSLQNAIVPGLDGRLYSYSESSTVHPSDDDDDSSYHHRHHNTAPVLEALPLTIHSILEHPVRSCTSDDPRDCGILTATAETTLLALDEQGHLLWKSREGAFSPMDDDDDDASTSKKPTTVSPLLLQRKDYWVQHVSTVTGRQAWNVSLGSYQALDFSTSSEDSDSEYGDDEDDEGEETSRGQQQGSNNNNAGLHALPDPDDVFSSSPSEKSPGLPAIAFSNAGRTLTAIDPQSGAILWKQTTPSVLSSVFGIDGGHWTPLTVWENHAEDDGLRFPVLDQNDQGLKFAVTRHRFPEEEHERRPDSMAEFWTRAAWEAARAAQAPPHLGDETTTAFLQRQQKLLPGRGEEQQNQQQQHFPPQQQLPTRVQHQKAVCLTGNCPGFVHPERNKYFGLPAPDHEDDDANHPDARWLKSSSRSNNSEATLQANGILISWELVGVMLASLLLILVGTRHWYLTKKEKWLAKETKKFNHAQTWHASDSLEWPPKVNATGISRSSSGDAQNSARYFRRSLSLPGAFGSDSAGLSTTSGQGELPFRNSHDNDDLGLSLSPRSNKNNEPALNDEKEEEEGAVINQAGIPLVRYSRYASEFEEMEAMGKGGFGTVFRCKNVLDGRQYAVKKISISGITTDKSFQRRLQRVLREVKILAVLDHPNIVRYYTAWLEMEATGPSSDTSALGSTRGDRGDYTGMSCYSSSLLMTGDSVSQWETESPPRKRAPYQQPANPLGWNNDFGIPEESSMSLRRSLRRDDDDSDDIFFMESPKRNTHRDDESEDIFFAKESKIENEKPEESKVENEKSQKAGTGNDNTTSLASRKQPASGDQLKKDSVRHTLYIQMQLCSESTVSDFLSQVTPQRRNVPNALRLFSQICQAVQYVHDKGLIHRDLKPSNCFMDSSGNIKVGDFGLSRESGCDNDESVLDESISHGLNANEDHTAGVGTRSYASPEQTKGSDYDSSTDVYSLGIILFELCYPMTTGMERNICLSRLRDHFYPEDWPDVVGTSFPTLKGLICSMLSKTPACRPTAKSVAQAIQSILGEFTIVSLDDKHGPEMILLRVEADHREDALVHTMELIRSAAEHEGDGTYKIVQYGLRSSSSTERPAAIMEFAVESPDPKTQGPKLVSILSRKPTIQKVRQVSHTMST